MTFYSILFEQIEDDTVEGTPAEPDFFGDLNLDQIIAAVTSGKQEYDLKPFFHSPLKNIRAIEYRHEIFQDLENEKVLESIRSFCLKMHAMREHLAQADKRYYRYEKGRWFLDAVEIYCEAASDLLGNLSDSHLTAPGLLAFREYLGRYIHSEAFKLLAAGAKQLLANLASVQYGLVVKDNSIRVLRDKSESDYSTEVDETFKKFNEGAVKDYRIGFSDHADMNHVEAKVLDFVADLYPEIFREFDQYCTENSNYLDKTVGGFDREIQFYVAYLGFIGRFKQVGLKFCYPQITNTDKEIHNNEGFDLALATKLETRNSIVCNDFHLDGRERIIVVSGPNQGGKTTFARSFGQLHYLASIGCPVPGREARAFLFDRLHVHFEREEHIQNLRGKLQDDLARIHSILKQATPNSVIILNEIFASTTLNDAIFLSKQIMRRIMDLDLLCVCVTFIDELASLSEKTVSMVSTVVPEDPALRTYKIVRMQADGLAYALSIAEKYRLTYESLKQRIRA